MMAECALSKVEEAHSVRPAFGESPRTNPTRASSIHLSPSLPDSQKRKSDQAEASRLGDDGAAVQRSQQ